MLNIESDDIDRRIIAELQADARLTNQRGRAYEAKGDQEHANADFEQAKRLGP